MVARANLIFGLHVHVGIEDGYTSKLFAKRLRRYGRVVQVAEATRRLRARMMARRPA